MSAIYSKSSPYVKTSTYSNFLDVADIPSIPKNPEDSVFVINETYNLKPQLLAYDLYGDVALWWVFAVRNPNVLQDPLFDFVLGTTIFLPNKDTLVKVLGV
jgi:hypothetical protein